MILFSDKRRNIAIISKCKTATIQYFFAFVNPRKMFLTTRQVTTGIENKKASAPKPATQGPLGDIFASTSIEAIAMA
jgi:hypothetical protein